MSAPDVSMPSTPDPSVLASVMTGSSPQMPDSPAPSSITLPAPDATNQSGNPAQSAPPSGGSRLKAILGAVANVAETGLAAIPQGHRPDFISGLGSGARAEQAAQAQQQDIKFKDFDSQLRAAQIHNDDLRIQNQTQEENDAHQKMENDQRDYDDDHNIEYIPHPSVGASVINTLQARSQADPEGASIAPGAYHSATGDTIYEPTDSDATKAGLTQKYIDLHAALGLPALQSGSNYVSGKNLDLMSKTLQGNDVSGKPFSKDALQNMLAGRDAQRAALVQSNASPFALKTFDNLTAMYKAKLNDHQDFEAQAQQKIAAGKAAGTASVTNNPTNQQAAATGAGLKAGAVAAAQAPYQQAKSDASKQTAQQNNGLTANEKLLNDPHTGVIGALAQINQTKASIRAGADGNALLTNMLPTMEVLGINHTAGITRISPAEATAAGTSPDWATRWNAFAQKAATGVLTPEMAAQGNQLMDILKQGALTKLYQQQSVLAKGRGIDPASMPSIDSNGNITTFDKVKGAPTGSPSGNVVSLSAARQLAINQGKSDAQIIADIQAHGHQVGQ